MNYRIAVLCISAAALVVSISSGAETAEWPQWRGPLGTGVAPTGKPPVSWGEEHNVRWKTPIPGKGHSTPIVWGKRIFVTTAIPVGETLPAEGAHSHGAHHNMNPSRKLEFVVLAVDRGTGEVLWRRTVHTAQPHESTHTSGSWASSSAVTDGRHVYASFGSNGLYCLDMNGELKWKKDLGDMRIKHGHGEGSSPALSGTTLVLNWDHEDESFVVALNKKTGKELWRAPREEGTSWSSPLIVKHGGKTQVIVSATGRVRGYDLKDGAVIWECGGLSGNVVASPVSANGIVHVANSYETRAMLAIDLDKARGDITGSDAVVWTRSRDTPYVPSPVLVDGTLCFLKHYQGMLTCVDAATGKPRFGPVRLPGIRNVYASLVAAAGNIYVVDLDGNGLVLENADSLKVVSVNHLDDVFGASPAIVGDEIILRGERFLYSIAETVSPQAGSGPPAGRGR